MARARIGAPWAPGRLGAWICHMHQMHQIHQIQNQMRQMHPHTISAQTACLGRAAQLLARPPPALTHCLVVSGAHAQVLISTYIVGSDQ